MAHMVHEFVFLLMLTYLRRYLQACNNTDLYTCGQAPTCPYSHIASSPVHTHTHALMHDYLFTCIIVSPHSSCADQTVTGSPHADRQRHEQEQVPTQSHSDIPTHAPVKADRHNHVSTNAHMHERDTCPHLLCIHAQTPCYDRAPNTCLAHIYTHAAARTLVHARSYKHAVGEPTHSLTQACSHSLTFHRDLSNGFYDSQTGHGHTRVVG